MKKQQEARVDRFSPDGTGALVTNDGTLLPIDAIDQTADAIHTGDIVKYEIGKNGTPINIRQA
jgi:hypothetical protein